MFVSKRCLSLCLLLKFQALREEHVVHGSLSPVWPVIKDQQQHCATSTEDERPLICKWIPRCHYSFKGDCFPRYAYNTRHIRNQSRKASQELAAEGGKKMAETGHKWVKQPPVAVLDTLAKLSSWHLAKLRMGELYKTTKASILILQV